MRNTQQILSHTRELLRQTPILWLPGFAVILLQDALFPLGLQHGRLPHLMGALAAAVAATMLLAGWYALMARVLRGGVATFRDFIDGINARWMTMVAGTCVYWLLIGSLAAIIFWYGQRSIGLDPLLAWFKPLLELPTAQQQAALEPSRIPRAVIEWMNLAAIWVSLVVALNALLVFWAPLAILQGQRWTAAWLGSAGLCLRRLGQVIAIGTLHIGSLLFARILMASFQPLTVMAGVALYMFSLTYFTMVYATVVEDEWPVDAKQTDLRA